MIRGVNRQVIVVSPEDSELFEQAVFFVRPSASRSAPSQDELLAEIVRIIGDKTSKAAVPRVGLFRRKKK